MAEAAKWYVVHTYSGYENTVKATIEKTVQSRQLQDQILTISIPMETVTEITDSGASKTYDRKLYPGYVFVKMVYSDDTWHVIRGVRGVSGFVGASGNDPIPLSGRSLSTTQLAIPSASSMVLCLPSPVLWKALRSKTIRSAWWFPCLAARLPSSSNWTRWKSHPNKRIGPFTGRNVGGAKAPQNMR